MHVVGPRGGTCGHHIYQIYASYLHVRILYEFLGTFQSLKVFGKFKNKSKCFWKPSSKFTIRNGYLVTVYKSGFEACLWSTSCASALVLALEIRRISSPCAAVVPSREGKFIGGTRPCTPECTRPCRRGRELVCMITWSCKQVLVRVCMGVCILVCMGVCPL